MLTLLAVSMLVMGIGASPPTPPPQAPVRVVATLPVYADIARQIGGSEVDATSIADPNEDAHFVRPKPSFALALRRADLFITTGLDLELWAPILLDRASNAAVMEGSRGYVTAYTGVRLLDIPTSIDRSQGDVHIYGNPHVTTDPLRALQVARNITTGLKRVTPDRAAIFDAGLARFTQQIHRRLFGAELVEMIGGPTLEQMALEGNLMSFLGSQEFAGRPLVSFLGGWLGRGQAFRDKQIICYHKNWAYFEERFGVTCAEYVEAKPGIPPTPGHVAHLIDRMTNDGLNVLLASAYFDADKVRTVAQRGGATAVIVPVSPGVEGVADYFALVDTWVDGLARAFGSN